ncbi:MAG: site-2 protease family protein [Anaerolineae bacterium]|nr:site-2 protease family protein [Anaerolineae bacterium]
METLLATLIRILEFVLALGVLIFLHELGHYLFAKLFKIEVEEFGFGFPPRMLRLFKLGETEFTLNWIPFGAFVRPKGENDPDVPGGMASANPWQRLMILFGGPLLNLVTGVLLFSLVYTLAGAPDLSTVQIAVVNANSPAESAGLLPGDVITAVQGQPVTSSQQLTTVIYDNLGKEISMDYRRGEQTGSVTATPREKPPEGEGALGIVMGSPLVKVSWAQSMPLAVQDTLQQARMIITMPIMLLSGEVSGDQARFVGPKGMYDIYQMVRTEDRKDEQNNATSAPVRTLSLLATISVALGITNLLPIPALDGGRILFLLPELLFRKRVPARYENMVHLIGFATLILLMIVITAQDIINPIQLR